MIGIKKEKKKERKKKPKHERLPNDVVGKCQLKMPVMAILIRHKL